MAEPSILEFSWVQLPSGNKYRVKDEVARALLAAGIKFKICWKGDAAPVIANIPAGVVIEYNGTTYTGTLPVSSAEPFTFYLVKTNASSAFPDAYDEYVVAEDASQNQVWEKIGSTAIDLSTLGDLAWLDNVTLNKGSGDMVLGESTTFTNGSSSVTFSGGTSDTFVKSYPGTTSKLVTTSVTGTNGTETVAVVSSKTEKKLTTTSIPNVTSAGTADTWSFTMGTGNDAETLIISGTNGTAATLGTAITAATGGVSETSATTNVGSTIVTTLTTTNKTLAKAADSSTTVATGGLDANGGGSSVMTGLGTATTASAVTGIGTGTAAAQSITVCTNDKVKVAKYDDLSVSVS